MQAPVEAVGPIPLKSRMEKSFFCKRISRSGALTLHYCKCLDLGTLKINIGFKFPVVTSTEVHVCLNRKDPVFKQMSLLIKNEGRIVSIF